MSGIATHYVLTGLPNCSYPSPPANGLFVALSPSEYDSAAACGGYLTVTGPDGSVTVQVIDQCPDCATGHIDLSEPAFAELAPLSAGLINVRYQYLADPPLPGPITMEVKSGSSQYWLALLADNTGNPLASVQVETASGGWVSLARASYNYWIAQSGAGADRSPSGSPTPRATRSPCTTSPSTPARSSPPASTCTARAAPVAARRRLRVDPASPTVAAPVRASSSVSPAAGAGPRGEPGGSSRPATARDAGSASPAPPPPGTPSTPHATKPRTKPPNPPPNADLRHRPVRGRIFRLFSFPRGRGNVGCRAPCVGARGGGSCLSFR